MKEIKGKAYKWDVLTGSFSIGAPEGDYEIVTADSAIQDPLIEAMKNRCEITLTIESRLETIA